MNFYKTWVTFWFFKQEKPGGLILDASSKVRKMEKKIQNETLLDLANKVDTIKMVRIKGFPFLLTEILS